MKTPQELQAMSIRELAQLMASEYPKLKDEGRGSMGIGQHPANPYFQALLTMNTIKDSYGADSGQSMVLYFLSNASSVRGENAKGIREELKRRLRENGYRI